MATSRSVAATVRLFSRAESLTHWRAGLGVREATTVPATVRASRRAPRLQITFMVRTPFLGCRDQARETGPPNVPVLVHYQKTLDRSRGGGAWRIVDKVWASFAMAGSDETCKRFYWPCHVHNLWGKMTRPSGGPPRPRQGGGDNIAPL